MTTKICYKCHGTMHDKETEITAGWGEYDLKVNGVNASVCDKCGAISLRLQEVQMLENLSKNIYELAENDRPDYLTVAETSDLLQVSHQTIYNKIRLGQLKGIKFGKEWRFSRSEIEK